MQTRCARVVIQAIVGRRRAVVTRAQPRPRGAGLRQPAGASRAGGSCRARQGRTMPARERERPRRPVPRTPARGRAGGSCRARPSPPNLHTRSAAGLRQRVRSWHRVGSYRGCSLACRCPPVLRRQGPGEATPVTSSRQRAARQFSRLLASPQAAVTAACRPAARGALVEPGARSARFEGRLGVPIGMSLAECTELERTVAAAGGDDGPPVEMSWSRRAVRACRSSTRRTPSAGATAVSGRHLRASSPRGRSRAAAATPTSTGTGWTWPEHRARPGDRDVRPASRRRRLASREQQLRPRSAVARGDGRARRRPACPAARR